MSRKAESLIEIVRACMENPALVEALEELFINGKPGNTCTELRPELRPVKDSPRKRATTPDKDNGDKAMEKPDTPKLAPKKPGRKPVDTGKIKSLRQGGWTVAEIADDLECSPQTVRNNLAKM